MTEADLRQLITREYYGLRLLIARRTRDPEVAADLLNEAICTSWEKWRAGEIREPRLIAGYVFQVALNLLRNLRRTVAGCPGRRVNLDGMNELESSHATELPLEDWVAGKVRDLIRSLGSSRDRMVLVRFYLEEEDRETICRDLDLSPLQFKTVLHRARKRLRALLESHGLKGSDLVCFLLCVI